MPLPRDDAAGSAHEFAIPMLPKLRRRKNVLITQFCTAIMHGVLTDREPRASIVGHQRPGTAKGFIFISMKDETGIANVIVTPDLYDRDRLVVTRSKFLLVEGPLQNQDSVIHIKTSRLTPLSDAELAVSSHDFH